MNLQYKNFCVLVAVSLTLLFCTPVFAQGPSDLSRGPGCGLTNCLSNGRTRDSGRARTDAGSRAWSGVNIPDRKYRR